MGSSVDGRIVGIPGINVLSFSLPPHLDFFFRLLSAALPSPPAPESEYSEGPLLTESLLFVFSKAAKFFGTVALLFTTSMIAWVMSSLFSRKKSFSRSRLALRSMFM